MNPMYAGTHIVEATGVGRGFILQEVATDGAELDGLALGLRPVGTDSSRSKGEDGGRDERGPHLGKFFGMRTRGKKAVTSLKTPDAVLDVLKSNRQ
jgi:hypothetical protein